MIPVKIIKKRLPSKRETGSFGYSRKFDVHTGIDLYCEPGTPVYACEDGIVVAIEKFTGQHSDSPWWNDTWALLVEDHEKVIVYGEIDLPIHIVGDQIKAGDYLGMVIPVSRSTKTKIPTSMLHFELHKKGTRCTSWWMKGEAMPDSLINCTSYLKRLYKSINKC